MQDALHIGCSLLGGYEGHTPKSCCLLRCTRPYLAEI